MDDGGGDDVFGFFPALSSIPDDLAVADDDNDNDDALAEVSTQLNRLSRKVDRLSQQQQPFPLAVPDSSDSVAVQRLRERVEAVERRLRLSEELLKLQTVPTSLRGTKKRVKALEKAVETNQRALLSIEGDWREQAAATVEGVVRPLASAVAQQREQHEQLARRVDDSQAALRAVEEAVERVGREQDDARRVLAVQLKDIRAVRDAAKTLAQDVAAAAAAEPVKALERQVAALALRLDEERALREAAGAREQELERELSGVKRRFTALVRTLNEQRAQQEEEEERLWKAAADAQATGGRRRARTRRTRQGRGRHGNEDEAEEENEEEEEVFVSSLLG